LAQKRWTRRASRRTGFATPSTVVRIAIPASPRRTYAHSGRFPAGLRSIVLAHVLVDELVRAGVRHVVLAPGSRSAPLAAAVVAAEAAGRLRLHVRIDERSAGFTALGLAKASGQVVAVVTTSGTAVANLHPAVLEAHHVGARLLVVTADRPGSLRGTGANQTTDQGQLFGTAARMFHQLGVPESRVGQNADDAGRTLVAARADLAPAQQRPE